MRVFFSSGVERAVSGRKGKPSRPPDSQWGPGTSLSPTTCPRAAPRTKRSAAPCFPAPYQPPSPTNGEIICRFLYNRLQSWLVMRNYRGPDTSVCAAITAGAGAPSWQIPGICPITPRELLTLARRGLLPLLCAESPFHVLSDKLMPPFAGSGFSRQLSEPGNHFFKRKSKFPGILSSGDLRSSLGMNKARSQLPVPWKAAVRLFACPVWSKIFPNLPKASVGRVQVGNRVGTGPRGPGAATGLGTGGFVKHGAGKGAGEIMRNPRSGSVPVPFGHSPSAAQ